MCMHSTLSINFSCTGRFPSLLVVLVLFFLQSPQSVHSQLNTCSGFNCTAQQCLNCDHVPATCTHSNETDSVDCWADTSLCRIEWCLPCSQCIGTYIKQKSRNFSDWQMFSHCFPVATSIMNASCTVNMITQRCIVERTDPLYLDVNNVSETHRIVCKCFEENCTQSLQYSVNILPQTRPPLTPPTTQSIDTPAGNMSV